MAGCVSFHSDMKNKSTILVQQWDQSVFGAQFPTFLMARSRLGTIVFEIVSSKKVMKDDLNHMD